MSNSFVLPLASASISAMTNVVLRQPFAAAPVVAMGPRSLHEIYRRSSSCHDVAKTVRAVRYERRDDVWSHGYLWLFVR